MSTFPSGTIHSKSPSPGLKPKFSGMADEVAKILATISNYRSILERTAQSLGISYRLMFIETGFDKLKKVVPYQPI
ncbi:uncharacterized protein OCT59_003145 [Rhizophagus irregularis]|uniref:Uncharacterized protein n=2 Tax=Rhizophagus irregularis TaxID=588596 RepID=A0A915YXY6_9GLOM|nr:hypothetical protein RirG_016110 [Rhizophagus irregularis DAOM 197198w]UZO11584.1 hypothetical protein OCT59_003145 [Rhizophagus irregularis]CAB4481235.1 unnamed protein product [Rhizophagus irregularis]CAB5208067.1 unnamed protein product [Rhizophagus irregularis]CAB5352009.1 unnamed protein product [Rhizophagus irregularis]